MKLLPSMVALGLLLWSGVASAGGIGTSCRQDYGRPCDAGLVCDGSTQRCVCDSNDDCDDGRFCNGAETCGGGVCRSAAPPCVGQPAPAGMTARCDESVDRCVVACTQPDRDGDGVASIACGGDDCDDADPNRFPGNTEVCDAHDVDEDCNPRTFGDRDADGDGYVDARCANWER